MSRTYNHEEHFGTSRKGDNICPKCKTNKRYLNFAYCQPCDREYQRERRRTVPNMTERETNYKRTYRMNLKIRKEIEASLVKS